MANQSYGSFTDSRDGQIYKTVQIGGQVWMAENLNYKPNGGKFWYYDNNSANGEKYGLLYDWNTALKVAPSGWHLPSDEEWNVLVNFVGGENTAGAKLKAKSEWNNSGNGTDDYGFSAFPGGYRRNDNESFFSVGSYGHWWSATENYDSYVFYRYMSYDNEELRSGSYAKDYGFSIRCLKD